MGLMKYFQKKREESGMRKMFKSLAYAVDNAPMYSEGYYRACGQLHELLTGERSERYAELERGAREAEERGEVSPVVQRGKAPF